MDRLIRAITADGMVKATAVTTRSLTERARQIHKTLPVATAALGRTLAAASMMGNALKSDGASLTIQVRGGGPRPVVKLLAAAPARGRLSLYCTIDPGGLHLFFRPVSQAGGSTCI